ncbi:TPA: restriction endonuclease subunit S [Streptococcus pyogenes]|uniref:restriction endonuclease subunit S n=1 Tax=Streptococcus pyogenes TaxID=1314 RepID=UPI00109BC9FD|nr:restriction endonuclease subunit S [Streptococcus pyogenes]VGQ30804.1 type I restriction modification DNA specificity domain-containing protein [Streptococcus pyogenes]HEQ2961723.1 restriction endonuclease subunit S [Streptococcus pyogenes]HEQ2969985.1 restriction endonuclease subunit S [Streptococcus pyogenes]HEQ2984538.1 restriction endonuclease subunit S [Streptococcus pyogenes]HEQ2987636.1 restriction endonuclease subunit S [Streptococcus pyogenes]
MTKSKQPQYRFDGFEGEWEEKKLGEISNIVRGASPRPIQDPKWFDAKSDIGWLRISDVTEQEGRITYLQQRISELGQEKTRVLKDPHLLLSIAATVGKPVINYVKTGVHDGFLVFLDPKFNREFMFQWLDMFRPYWNKYGQPGSQVNLNSEIVRNQVINLPSLPEQEAIGELFQMVDQLIQLQDQKLATLKEQKQTFLRKMFPAQGQKVPEIRLQGFKGEWEEKKLGEVSTHRSGTAIEKYFDSEGEFKVISIGSYGTNNLYVDQNIRAVSNELTNSKLVASGELTMVLNDKTANGAIIGRCLLITENNKYVVNQRTEIIRPDINISSYYLFHYLNGEFRNGIIKIAQGGTQIYVNYSSVEQLKINIPTLKEQEAIGDFFQTLDQQIAQSEEKLTELKALKQTLLNRLFV